MRTWYVVALLTLIGGCAEGPLDPATALMAAGSIAGLQQLLEVQATTHNGVGHFTITSTLLNGGDEPVTLKVRSCYLRDADLRGERAGLLLSQPLMLCASDGHEITLAPGEASEPLAISGAMPAGSSRDLEVRHALAPEHWAPVTVTAP